MKKPQILGISGCVILFIGGFLPMMSAPGARSLHIFELPFFYVGLYLALVLASAYLLWRKDYKPLALTGVLAPLPVIFCLLNAMSAGGLLTPRVWGLFFQALDYGWLVLLAGAALLYLASGFRWQDGLKVLIPKDFSRRGASPAMPPPPPPGAMPPPPQSVTPPPVTSQICAHCQAPMNPSAKFCRACGTPIAQAAAAPPVPVCPHCQAPLSVAAKFCRACGTPVINPAAAHPTVCPRCGVGLEPDERFCSGCGQQIAAA